MNTAANGNIPGTIVKRDAGGSVSAASITLNGNLTLPPTTPSSGIIFSGNTTLLHTFGSASVYAGLGAGNLTTVGGSDTGFGDQALAANTSGSDNTAVGYQSLFLNTGGLFNTAMGSSALSSNANGFYNTAIGYQSLLSDTNNANTAIGYRCLVANVSGLGNTAIGEDTLDGVTSGNENIALGQAAGTAIVTGSSNIDIGNPGFGNESGAIRIGTTQTKAVIVGIFGATIASGGSPVLVNSSGLLGTLTSSARFKQNIRSMADTSHELLALRPVSFEYKPEIDPKGTPQFGLVAEEVEKVDPNLVVYDDKHQVYSVRYEAVNAMLLNEFLKEHQKVAEQSTEIQQLQRSVAELKKMVQSSSQRK